MEETQNLLTGEDNEDEEEEAEPSEGQPEAEEEADDEGEIYEDSSWQWEQDRRYEEWRSLLPYRLAHIIIIPVFLGALFFIRTSSSAHEEPKQHTAAFPAVIVPPPPTAERGSSLSAWALAPLTTLVERDRALREISSNPWTASLSPELAYTAQQQRLLPIWALGGLGVTALQLGGHPIAAGVAAATGILLTGRSFPDLSHFNTWGRALSTLWRPSSLQQQTPVALPPPPTMRAHEQTNWFGWPQPQFPHLYRYA